MVSATWVGNQLPILLISFHAEGEEGPAGWESVTNPLDKLFTYKARDSFMLGISYQSS